VFQTIFIEDQAPHLMEPNLDLYCLQKSFKLNMFLKIVRFFFYCSRTFGRYCIKEQFDI